MPVVPSMTTALETSDLTRQVAGGTSGFVPRRSIATKAASKAAATASRSHVRADAQPCCAVPTTRVDERHQACEERDGAKQIKLAPSRDRLLSGDEPHRANGDHEAQSGR